MKTTFAKLISMLLLITMISACGSNAQPPSDGNSVTSAPETGQLEQPGQSLPALDPDNPTKITFYAYSLALPTMKSGMERLIQTFNDTVGKEKGVIVEPVADQTLQQFRIDIAAGKQVDVIQHLFPTIDSSRINLELQAFEDIFPQEELDAHLEGISPNALELGKIDGKMYGMAFTFSTPMLFINGKLFEQASLDPDRPPTTWEDVKQAALRIKETTGKDGFGLGPNNSWITDGLILSNGGEVLSADRQEAKFAGEESIEAIEMWQDLYQSGAHAIGTDTELMEQFSAGNLGMLLTTSAYYSGFQKGAEAGGWSLYGAGLPQFGDRLSVPVNSGSALVVRPDSPERTAAVWEFIKYATGKEGYTIITSEIGYLPLRTDIADDPNYLKDFVDQNPLYRINLEQLERIHPAAIWPGEYATEAAAIYNDAIVKSVTTDADVAATLKEAQNQIANLLQ